MYQDIRGQHPPRIKCCSVRGCTVAYWNITFCFCVPDCPEGLNSDSAKEPLRAKSKDSFSIYTRPLYGHVWKLFARCNASLYTDMCHIWNIHTYIYIYIYYIWQNLFIDTFYLILKMWMFTSVLLLYFPKGMDSISQKKKERKCVNGQFNIFSRWTVWNQQQKRGP